MTHVMDGVRRAPAMPLPMLTQRPVSAIAARPQARRYVVGMDGIRRPAPLSPREMLVNMHSEPVPAMVAAAPMAEPWKMPSLRLPEIEWKRSAVAFGLVASAIMVTSFGIHAVTTPRPVSSAEVNTASAAAPAPVKAAPVVAPVVAEKAGLQQIVDGFAAANPGTWGIVVKDLKTGATASYQPDRQFTSASLYKLFVAQRIYQRIDIGQLDYSAAAGGGTGRNIDGCLTIMINISDNGCGRALGSILGWGAQNQALQQEGYEQTSLTTPQKTSAADVARLYGRLYDGTLLSPNSTQRFLGLLKDQRVNNRLPVGLPQGTVIAHKTGDLDGVTHDAGIVYGPKTDYVVVVTSGPWATPAGAAPKFADLSSKLWAYFQQ